MHARVDDDWLATDNCRASRVDSVLVVRLVVPDAYGEVGPVDKISTDHVPNVGPITTRDAHVILVHQMIHAVHLVVEWKVRVCAWPDSAFGLLHEFGRTGPQAHRSHHMSDP